MRLELKPGLPIVRRGPSTVQIGLDARHGTVLDGLTAGDLALLEELAAGVDADRLAPGARRATSADQATRDRGVQRARSLIGLLADTGVLQRTRTGRAALHRLGGLRQRLAPDAAAWSLVDPAAGDGWELLADRRRATVEVRGSGRAAMVLAGTLAAAGVGSVRLIGGDPVTAAELAPGGACTSDVGRPAADVAAAVVARALGPAPGPAQPIARAGQSPDLVVLVDRAAADPVRGDRLLAADVPHLSIVVRETSVVIGPLVVPGQGACLRCLDLHRTERDRQWPTVLAQLVPGAAGARGRRAPREETALAQVAAGVAALQVLVHLDGRRPPASRGATLEVELPDGLVSRRPWAAHPSCGCGWPPGRARARTGASADEPREC